MNNLHRKVLLEEIGLTEDDLRGPDGFWSSWLETALDDGVDDGIIEEITMYVEEWRENR